MRTQLPYKTQTRVEKKSAGFSNNLIFTLLLFKYVAQKENMQQNQKLSDVAEKTEKDIIRKRQYISGCDIIDILLLLKSPDWLIFIVQYASPELSHSSICLPLCQCLCWQTGRDDEGGR